MKKIVKQLTLMNNYYKKFLWLAIPITIILMNFLDLLFWSMEKGQLYVTANVCIIASLLIVLARYLYYGKNDLFCLCATISVSYISILLSVSLKIDIHPIIAIPLICLFCIALAISLMVRFYDFYHNGR